MPIFPVIDTEALVQENDKTRLNGVKSFSTAAITQIEISPSAGEALIDVTENGYLDWVYDFKIDIDADNESLDFKEGAGPELTATLTPGSYTLAALASEIKTQLDAAGGQVYTVEVVGDLFTISAPGAFTLLAGTGSNVETGILSHLGYGIEDTESATSHEGETVETVQKKITLKVTSGLNDVTITRYLEVISSAADKLFSSDADLRSYESDILDYVPEGRASWLDVHRRAQTKIIDWLDTEGYVDEDNEKFTKDAFVDLGEVRPWATQLALQLIFEGLVTGEDTDDSYVRKAKKYEVEAEFYRKRAILRIDTDGDSAVDTLQGEGVEPTVCVVRRR